DFALALLIEDHYPYLNDSLGSTVQFLQRAARREPVDETHGSPSLRREAVERTLRQVQALDFNRVVNADGLGLSGAVVVGALALTALERLTVPFGGKDWPKQTQLEIQALQRVARGEAFEIRGILTGVIPDESIVYFEGVVPPRQVYPVRRDRDQPRGQLLARL